SDSGAFAGDLSRFRTKELNRAPYLGGIESYDGYGRGWANVSNTPLRSFKAQTYEGGICTPLIVSGPVVRLKPGSVVAETGHVVDLMATVADMAETRYPGEYDG